ncbi:MAG TPA: putative sugar nucleotidyl transferase [Ignavibacteriaceae bacterium]|nr:putative sugar nucleotidyl transferase [Ignavibacteriaceae bacterium]
MHICIFEDKLSDNFYPLSLSRPVFDLLYGMNTLREKILNYFPNAKFSLFCRDYLKESVKQNHPGIEVNELKDDNYLFINGRVLMDEIFYESLTKNTSEKVYKKNDNLIAAKVTSSTINKIRENNPDSIELSIFEGIPEEAIEIDTIDFIWDMIINNGSVLRNDFRSSKLSGISDDARLFRGVDLINKDDVTIESEAIIKPGVVIDASNGPVYISNAVEIFPNSVIEGPAYIGEKTKIKSCAIISENVSIGAVCKIGGEVEQSLIMPYSNKQHTGYIGHSYLGSWVNLGANTICSDLKNNYSNINLILPRGKINTGLQFLGLIMGDHTKTAISTMFTTGTIVGFSSNILSPGFQDKFIPSFSWGGKGNMVVYDVEKSIITAKTVMKRRNVNMTEADENLFKNVFNMTNSERQKPV